MIDTSSGHPIAVLYYPAKRGAQELAAQIAAEITALDLASAQVFSMFELDPALLRDYTLAITVGGDGSILGAARLCAPLGIPLLPVQQGRLGMLAELEAHQVGTALPSYLRGDCRPEAHLMLAAAIDGGEHRDLLALNEIVAARGISSGPIRVDVTLDGAFYSTVWADGLIVSTPTGSTAYARSAGGPIIHPDVPSFSLTAVAPQSGHPHLLVIPPDEEIRLHVTTDAGNWVLLADGLVQAQLPSGVSITLRRAPYDTIFLRRGDRYRLQRRLRDMITGNPRPGDGGPVSPAG